MTRLSRPGHVVLTAMAAVAVLVSAGCSVHHATPAAAPTPVVVSGLPEFVTAAATDVGSSAAVGGRVTLLSDVYSLTPASTLDDSLLTETPLVTVTVALRTAVASTTPVVAMTRQSASQPWTFVPAAVTSDRSHVQFKTPDRSVFGVMGIDVAAAVATFKQEFVDDVAGGATATVAPATCAEQDRARQDLYSATSNSGEALYWCFGAEHDHRVLKLTDRRPYPIEIAHPGVPILAITAGAWPSLGHLHAGSDAILGPGATVTFDAALSHGSSLTVSTATDGVGQSLSALRAGVHALASVLGADSATTADAASRLLSSPSCAAAIGKGSDAVVAGCFGSDALSAGFAARASLLAPVVSGAGLPALVASEWASFADRFAHQDHVSITIRRAAQT